MNRQSRDERHPHIGLMCRTAVQNCYPKLGHRVIIRVAWIGYARPPEPPTVGTGAVGANVCSCEGVTPVFMGSSKDLTFEQFIAFVMSGLILVVAAIPAAILSFGQQRVEHVARALLVKP